MSIPEKIQALIDRTEGTDAVQISYRKSDGEWVVQVGRNYADGWAVLLANHGRGIEEAIENTFFLKMTFEELTEWAVSRAGV